jgi:hypothetical protein
MHLLPYQTLPRLDCHIAPPHSPSLMRAPNTQGPISMRSREHVARQMQLSKHSSTDSSSYALRGTFLSMPEGTQRIGKWKRGVRGRGTHDDEDIERFLQPSHRTARSQSRSSRGSAGRKSAPAHKGFNTVEDRCGGSRTNRRRHLELADGNGHIARPEPLSE